MQTAMALRPGGDFLGSLHSRKYERQTGTELPDSVLVATLLNKTTGALQQHLRLNARSLTTYTQIRDVIVEYLRSRHILTSSPAPMDIGALWRKGKGKGNPLWNKGKGKSKDKGLPGKGKGTGLHWDFQAKAKGKAGKGKDFEKNKRKGKGKNLGSQLCWTCGRPGHLSSTCPIGRVNALEEIEALQDLSWTAEESVNFGFTGNFEYEDPWDTWYSWDVSALWNDEETLWNEDWSWSDATWHDGIGDWSHSQQTLVEPTVSRKAGNLTSATSSEPRASALGPLDTGRVAAVISEPPGLLRPSPKAKAPSGTSLASNLLMSAVVFGSFGLGASLHTERLGGEDMMTGVVDFTCGCLESPWLTWNRSGLDTTCLDDFAG